MPQLQGLFDRLLNPVQTSPLGMQGSTPSSVATQPSSRLHYTYSINGIPTFANKPNPSQLDLDGATPIRYWDVRPQ